MHDKLIKLGQSRHLQAAGVGILLALAFPKPAVAGLAWVAPGLMLLVAAGLPGGKTFRLGYLAGLGHWLVALHWLLFIPVKFLPILGWLSLGAYLALYQGFWVWACWKLFPAKLPANNSSSFTDTIAAILAASRLQRALWAVACAMAWVFLEMMRARLLTGFPWNLLGVSQGQILPLAQLAAITGVYGLSFIIVWASVTLMITGLMHIRHPNQQRFTMTELIPPVAVLAVIWLWGASELWRKIAAKAPAALKIALVQPSIPQTLIWDKKENDYRFQKLLELSQAALTNKPDLLVWPEAAVPEMLRYDEPTFQAVTGLAASNHIWLIIGSDDMEPVIDPDAVADRAYYNAAFLISPAGKVLQRYCKRQLVIFGEYVPLSRWLPFLNKLTPIGDGFAAGTSPEQFLLRVASAAESSTNQNVAIPRAVQTSILICFEDIFPNLAREAVEADTDFLLNLTNDGWFKESAAQYQHAANSVFRAIETGRPLVRCTNNGRTCWIDPAGGLGSMTEHFASEKQDVYAEGFKLARIPLLSAVPQPTFYHRHGDWFGWICTGVTVLLLLAKLLAPFAGRFAPLDSPAHRA